jgi:hypothetical protein
MNMTATTEGRPLTANGQTVQDSFNEIEDARCEATRQYEAVSREHQSTRHALATAVLLAQGDMTDETVKNAVRAVMETGQRVEVARATEKALARARQIVGNAITRNGALKGD